MNVGRFLANAAERDPAKPALIWGDETLFFEDSWGRPFPRDEEVVSQLTKERLLQDPMPKPSRFDELKFLSRMYGYPE